MSYANELSHQTLRIQLDPPCETKTKFLSHLFIPGDRISGRVILRLGQDETIHNVSIELKGKCKTKTGQGKHSHHGELEFFTHYQKLFKGPFKIRASIQEYPFTFTMPENFNLKPSSINEFHDQNFAPASSRAGPQPLPPSFSHCEDYNTVYYHLTARVPRSFIDWEDKLTLHFSQARKEPNPAPFPKLAKDTSYSQEHVHYRLTDQGTCRLLSTSESFKARLRPDTSISTVNFNLQALAPTQIVIGRPYTIEITLLSPEGRTGNILPEFSLVSASLILKTYTAVRVASLFSDYHDEEDGHVPIPHFTLPLPLSLPVNKSVQLDGMFPAKNNYATPSFECWAIKRRYGLELEAGVKCLGELRRFKIKWQSVTLLPARMEEGVEEAIREIENGSVGMGGEGALPGYEDGGGGEELPSYGNAVDGSAA